MKHANEAWEAQIRRLLNPPVSTRYFDSAPRGINCREIIGDSVTFDMKYPVVDNPKRKLSYDFMKAEARWIVAGSNDLSFHPEIYKKLLPYSDNGYTMAGAYGPMIMQQRDYVVDQLKKEDTRQAALTIWKPNPAPSRDIPCTLAMQFLIRENFIYTIVSMRSSDAWMGLPYDMYSFTAVTRHIAELVDPGLLLASCTINMGSSHLYQYNWDQAVECVKE